MPGVVVNTLCFLVILSVAWSLFQAMREGHPGPPLRKECASEFSWFIHVPKNAGTFLVNEISEKGMVENLIKYTKHARAADYPPDVQRRCVAVVRNPYDRLVSFYTYARRQGNSYSYLGEFLVMYSVFTAIRKRTFKEFVKNIDLVIEEPYVYNLTRHIHGCTFSRLYGQDYHLYDETRGAVLPTLMRFENITDDVQRILGVDIRSRPRMNDSRDPSADWREYYDQETADIVYERYMKDFELFGYERSSWIKRAVNSVDPLTQSPPSLYA